MSGIDKLEITVLRDSDYNTVIGSPLDGILENARRNGLQHRPCYLPNENKPAMQFIDSSGHIKGCFVGYNYYSRMITRIILTPTRFNTFSTMMDLLRRTGLSDITGSYVNRIDFAADYSVPFSTLIRGLDIAARSNTRVHFDQSVGLPRTIYFGAGQDMILAYDKEFQQRNQNPPSAPGVQTRIERQVRTRRLIHGILGRDIYLQDLPDMLHGLCTSGPNLFEAVTLNSIALQANDNYSERQRARQNQMEGMMQISSYANMRRYINTTGNGNFIRDWKPLLTITPLPDAHQPDAVFKAGLRRYLGLSTRRRPPLIL